MQSIYLKRKEWIAFVKDWRAIMYAKTEGYFEELWQRSKLRADSAIIKYIVETWIPYKEMFVTAWTDQITHFGHTATSRGESAGYMLK